MDHFDEIFNNLSNKLRRECILPETSQYFTTLKTDFERFKVCYSLLEEANLLPDFQKNSRKNASKSAKFRNEGNCAFFKRNDMVALQYYSKSINFAPEGSEELALGFANRSAVSLSLNKFSDCITDIDRAFACNYPEHLQYKLYERKGKSLLKLGKIKLAEDSYRIALESVKKSKLSEEKLNNFKNALERELQDLKVQDISNIDNNISNTSRDFPNGRLSNNFENSSDEFNNIPKLSFPQNKEIPAACDAIRIEYSDEMGRHVVATKDISPGDVLVVEQPYVSVLLPSAYYLYCFNCLKRCHTLLPCPRCTKALYCCESCRENNWTTSHSIECNVLEYLTDFGCTKLELLALRTLIISSKIDKLNELKDYIENIEIKHQSIVDNRLKGFNDNNEYISSDYCTTYYLATNTELRTIADLFRRSCIASIIIHCVDKLTNYFDINKCDINDDINNYFDMKCFAGGLLLKYLQIMPCNAHEVSEMCLNKTTDNVVNDNSTDNNSFIYDSVEIGGALYPILSLINHSCDPNVVRHSHNGDTVVLTAIQQIKKGEQILDNYGYHHAVHDCNVRQNHLLSQYHFICHCIACTEDWPRYHFLPHKRIVYKVPEMQKEVEESSKEFRILLQNVLRGDFTSDVLNKLTKHLSLLQAAVKRPWKEYSECQEAIKQTLSMHANHYVHCTSTKPEISQ